MIIPAASIAFLVVFVIVLVLVVVQCCKTEEASLPPPPPTEKKKKVNPDKIFQDNLEEISENVAFHVIDKKGKINCFPMDQFDDDVPYDYEATDVSRQQSPAKEESPKSNKRKSTGSRNDSSSSKSTGSEST